MRSYAQSEEDVKLFIEKYENDSPEAIAIDTETTGFLWDTDEAFLIQIGWGWHDNYAIPVEYASMLNSIFEDESTLKIFHNCKFDLHFLKNLGITVKGKINDTMTMARLLLNGDESIGLNDLTAKLIDKNVNEAEKVMKDWMRAERSKRSKALTSVIRELGSTRKAYDLWKKTGEVDTGGLEKIFLEAESMVDLEVNYSHVPVDIMEKYATGDVKYTLALFNKFKPMIERNQLIPTYARDLQTIQHVFSWERQGINVNLPYLYQGILYGEHEMKELEEEIQTLAGEELNIKSPKQVIEVFAKRGKVIKSSDEETMNRLAEEGEELAHKIVEYRKYAKILGTYFKPIYERARKTGGVIHANFNVTGPVTGRFSSSDPNLQNIPNYDLGDKLNVKKAFIPNRDSMFVFMDYSQMEVRIMAEYSGDEALTDAILNDKDLHTLTALAIDPRAREIYDPTKTKDEQTDEFKKIRDHAKATTFGIFYGMGARTLSTNLKISYEQAREYVNNFFTQYPGVLNYMNAVQHVAQTRPGQFVINKFGRVYWGVEGREYRLANYLIQGTGADMAKVAIDRCEKILKGTRSRIVLMVHDELIFEIHKDEQYLIPKLKEAMEYFPEFKIPFTVGVDYSETSWDESMKYILKEEEQCTKKIS